MLIIIIEKKIRCWMLVITIEKKIRWLDVGYYNRKENKMVGC